MRGPGFTFIILFALIYGALQLAYFQVPNDMLVAGYRSVINTPAAWVINALSGEVLVTVDGHRLVSRRVILEVVRGCDGVGLLFLLVSAILAFAAPWKAKAIGIALSTALIYVLNELRIIALFFVVAERPDWFVPLHTLYIPTLLVLAAFALFASWLSRVRPNARA